MFLILLALGLIACILIVIFGTNFLLGRQREEGASNDWEKEEGQEILVFADLGEKQPLNSKFEDIQNIFPYPFNQANKLFEAIKNDSKVRSKEKAKKELTQQYELKNVNEFEKCYAYPLSSSEFTLNEKLGVISLKESLNPNDVLAVAYEYEYKGEQFKIGEYSSSQEKKGLLFLKMLKNSVQSKYLRGLQLTKAEHSLANRGGSKYEKNRHFFLSKFFKRLLNSSDKEDNFKINQIEVWVTNKRVPIFLIKKHPSADIFRYRGVFLKVGYVIALAVIILAFNWTQYDYSLLDLGQSARPDDFEIETPPPTNPQEPPPPPPPPKLEVVEDEKEIEEEPEIEDVEIDEDLAIEIEEEDPDEERIFEFVEEMPEFPGGYAAMVKFIQKNLQYPPMARENSISGRVYLKFVVEPSGEVSKIQLLRGIGGGCDEEAIRVVKKMPKWKPGRQRGKAVRVLFNLPIRFQLQ